jgi:hypothetical protein
METKQRNGGRDKNPAAVSLGRLGGMAGRGIPKNGGSENARRAAMIRWEKQKTQGKAQTT